ncbi:hypothetical protein EGR_09552 [Echinococcus granulosus]|uniref:Uncharacterized protein n=1 Tax=Echinococcus granulosus TaxID=6210 RepID=W6UAW4_ECHGR|nr:hypothetical protein EGR_09552 [Echinococcus granulosus]EUB55612.1 hypothetical protein EGR_09552 [Echinococcus granulosus]
MCGAQLIQISDETSSHQMPVTLLKREMRISHKTLFLLGATESSDSIKSTTFSVVAVHTPLEYILTSKSTQREKRNETKLKVDGLV